MMMMIPTMNLDQRKNCDISTRKHTIGFLLPPLDVLPDCCLLLLLLLAEEEEPGPSCQALSESTTNEFLMLSLDTTGCSDDGITKAVVCMVLSLKAAHASAKKRRLVVVIFFMIMMVQSKTRERRRFASKRPCVFADVDGKDDIQMKATRQRQHLINCRSL
jgi:hypothetical protein